MKMCNITLATAGHEVSYNTLILVFIQSILELTQRRSKMRTHESLEKENLFSARKDVFHTTPSIIAAVVLTVIVYTPPAQILRVLLYHFILKIVRQASPTAYISGKGPTISPLLSHKQ